MRIRSWALRAAVLLLVISGIGVGGVMTSSSAQAVPGAGDPFDCTGSYVYSIDYQNGQNIYSVPTEGIGAGPVAATVVSAGLVNSTARNAFAMTPGGTMAYYIATVGGANYIYQYDPIAGTSTRLGSSPVAPPQGGAYDPLNGYYYFGNTAVGSPLYAYDPADQTLIGQVGTLPANATSPTGGGDFAFDNAGDFFWTNGPSLYNLPATAVPSTPGTAPLASATLVSVSTLGNQPGIAFDPAGHLYEVTQSGVYTEVHPITGATTAGSQGSQGTNIADMAGCNPPSSLTVRKDVTDRTHAGDQFTIGIAPAGGTPATVTTTGTDTGLQGASVATVGVVNLSYTVSETAAGTTDPSTYVSTYRCIDTNHPEDDLGLAGTGRSFTFAYPGGDDRRIVCTFTNTPRTATIELTKALGAPRSAAADQFTVAVRADSPQGPALNATDDATTTGTGSQVDAGSGTTGATRVIAARTYYLTEAMASGSASSLAQYRSSITCTDANGVQSGLPSGAPFTGPLAITPLPDAAISCQLTNSTIPPTLRVTKALASTRFDDADQFAVAIRQGSATGPVVSDPADATTSGDGATVSAGTGTTGTFTASAGTTYYVTEAATANGGRYGATISCTDANGFQGGLPSGAAFTGSLAIVPVSGAAISCTLTNRLAPASLSLVKTNPAALQVGVSSDYELSVTNTGGQTSEGATVADRLPAGVAYAGARGDGWSCEATGNVATGQLVVCDGPSIPGSATSVVTITVTPTPDAGGTTVRNLGAVDVTGGSDPVDPSTCAADGVPTAGCAVPPGQPVSTGIRLSLAKANPDHLTVGVASDYTLTVTNEGTGPASMATVGDLLPEGLGYDSASGAECTIEGRLLTCTVPGPIAPGGSESLTITVTPAAGATSAVNRAAVDPDGGDEPVDPGTCTVTDAQTGCAVTPPLTVGVAELQLVKSATPIAPGTSPVSRGDLLRYAFSVTNVSDVALTDLRVDDPKAGPVSCPSTTLAPRASVECAAEPYEVTQADLDAGGVVNTATASATLTGCATDCELGSPTATARTATASVAALSLVKSASAAGVDQPGGRIVYTFTIVNTGSVTVTDVTASEGVFTGTGPRPAVDCPGAAGRLAPGDRVVCTATYVLTAADVEAGSVSNTATATGVAATGPIVSSASSRADVRVGSGNLPVTGAALDGGVFAFGLLVLLAGGGLIAANVLGRRRRRLDMS